jgi:hypothetical protein
VSGLLHDPPPPPEENPGIHGIGGWLGSSIWEKSKSFALAGI